MPNPNAARWLVIVATGLAIALVFAASNPLSPGALAGDQDVLEEARRYFREKSYGKALERFRKALDLDDLAAERDAIRLDIGSCLSGLKRWPEAIRDFEALIAERAETLTAGRAHHRLGVLYLRKPHYAYFKDGKNLGTERVPGATRRWIELEELELAKRHLEAGREVFNRLLERPTGPKPGESRRIPEERASLNFRLAEVLERLQLRMGGWWWGGDAAERERRIERVRPLHREVLAVLKENYLSGVLAGRTRDAARALYHRAMYLRRYTEKWWAKDPKTKKLLPLAETPEQLLERLLSEFPSDGFADDARYGLGLLAAGKQRYTEAVNQFRSLVKEHPDSPWGKDARRRIAEIQRPVLQVTAGGIRLPGSEPVIKVRTRNITALSYVAYRVPLERYLGNAEAVKALRTRGFQNLAGALEEIAGRNALRRNKEAEWKQATPDAGEHRWHDAEVTVPVSGSGAYLIEASAPGASQAAVLIVSDLAVVRKQTRDRSLFFVADARTGAPVDGASILARQTAHDRAGLVDAGRTNANGLWSCPNRFPVGMRYSYIDAFAWLDGRYALTGWSYHSWRSTRLTGKIYGFTDRGAYRPGQKVHFAALIRKTRSDGGFENLTGRQVALEIQDPRRKKLHTGALTTDDYGMIQGEWTIPLDAGLGRYRLAVSIGGRRGLRSSIYFRVEEYKRPEFEVTVKAARPTRAGEILPVKIEARYYFGGPVAGARVKYSTFRRAYRHAFRFSDPFAFLYDRPAYRHRGGDRYPGSSREELVGNGEGVTDAAGNLVIEIETDPWVKKFPDEDHVFRVRAEVMDQSRRTIEGSGTVKINRTTYFAALRPQRAFVAPGETVSVEVRTEDADGRAVAVSGVVQVVKTVPPPPTPKRRGTKQEHAERPETPVESLPVATNEHGRAFIRWKTEQEGYFVLRYEGRDATEARVTAETPLWVCGRRWTGRSYRFENLEILTDKDTYQVGEVARVLVNAAVDNPTLLLSQEADRDLLAYEVRRVAGRSTVLDIPVRKAMQPNFFLCGLTIHGGRVYQAETEVFIPPVEQFLNVDVAFTRSDYRPGQAGDAVIRVTDHDGKPVAGRVAFGAVDASLDYIQGDATPDIRRHFYGSRRRRGVEHQNSFSFQSQAATWLQVKLGRHRWSGQPPGWNGFPGPTDLWSGYLDDGDKGTQLGEPFLEERQTEERVRRSRGLVADGADAEPGAPKSEARGPAESKPAPGFRDEAGASRSKKGRFGRRALGPVAPAAVRENFAETAYFNPAVDSGEDGSARVHFTFPDSLTRWRATARAFTRDTRVGQRRATVVTTKNLLVRPQAPRFFREKDEVVLSAIVNSAFSEATEVEVGLELAGDTLELLDPARHRITVKPGGETRVDWRVRVVKSGQAEMRVQALSERESDAVKRTFPVLRYGSPRTVTSTADLKDAGRKAFEFTLPAERASGSAGLEVTLNPSLAGVLLDAMPFLLQYPYGCVEQTMNRFLPAVVVRATLRRLGINLEDLQTKRRDLPRAAGLGLNRNPVFDSDTLHDIVAKGMQRLKGFQRPDGGFGWFPGGASDPYMTAYVLYGLKRAMEAEVSVDGGMRRRALDYLQAATADTRDLHRAVYQCFVLALHRKDVPPEVLARVFKARDALNHYGRALLALAAHHDGRTEWARIAIENLEDFVQHDPRTGASWLPVEGSRWCWWADGVETNAFALMALNEIKPTSPHPDGLMRWLVASRRGNRWRSTKDTAHAIFALAGHMERTGELDPDLQVEVRLNGEPIRKVRITRENLLTFDNVLRVPDGSLASGRHVLTVATTGKGRLYVLARMRYFSREDVIPAAGHEMTVGRSYYRVTPVRETVRGKAGLTWKREKLEAGARIRAGDRLEVELELDAFHDYEYLMIEDPKPSGFESVALRSGGTARGGLWTFMELRDNRVVFFVPRVPRGAVKLPYQVRAEVPGRLNAMPTTGQLMYAPEVGGNSVSWKVEVGEGE